MVSWLIHSASRFRRLNSWTHPLLERLVVGLLPIATEPYPKYAAGRAIGRERRVAVAELDTEPAHDPLVVRNHGVTAAACPAVAPPRFVQADSLGMAVGEQT